MSHTDLLSRFLKIRRETEQICKPLQIEDYVIQAMEDVSPPKWHLAHTTWFFEQFILDKFIEDYEPYHPLYYYLFNIHLIKIHFVLYIIKKMKLQLLL